MKTLSLDITAFYNVYDELRNADMGRLSLERLPKPLHILAPFTLRNKKEGETYGVECAADWKPLYWWDMKLAYTFLKIHLRDYDNSTGADFEVPGASPQNQVSLRSLIDLPKNVTFDVWLRYVDSLPSFGSSCNRVGKKQHKIGIDWLWITRNGVFIGIRNLA
jgi:iron complex outermembrane receptor protein